MSILPYYNFDLWLLPNGESFHALVIDSPTGQAITTFHNPFSEDDFNRFLSLFGRGPLRGTRNVGKQLVEEFGGRLFDALIHDDVREAYRRSLDSAQHDGAGLRIRLRLRDVPQLADLPWEFLYDSPRERFLALSKSTPVVRYLNLPEPVIPLAVQVPLNILVVLSGPTDYEQLNLGASWERLRAAMADLEAQGKVSLDRLEEANVDALVRRLRIKPYHLFHFIGMGGFNELKQEGFVVFTDEQGRGREISGELLGTLLRDERSLRIVVLDTSETARTSLTNAFAGVAPRLVQQGIPAVMGMQYNIADETAITLSQEFYRAVADGYPIDAAMNEARRAAYFEGSVYEWGTPVLFMRAADGIVFTRSNAA
jgi:hypothetical protein